MCNRAVLAPAFSSRMSCRVAKTPGPRPLQLFPGTYMDICFLTESLVTLEDSGNREFVNPAEPGREGAELGKRMGEARNTRL